MSKSTVVVTDTAGAVFLGIVAILQMIVLVLMLKLNRMLEGELERLRERE